MKKFVAVMLMLMLMLCCGIAMAENITLDSMGRGVNTSDNTLIVDKTTLDAGDRYCVYVKLYNGGNSDVLIKKGDMKLVAEDGSEWENSWEYTIHAKSTFTWKLVRSDENWSRAQKYTFSYQGKVLKSMTLDFSNSKDQIHPTPAPAPDLCSHCYGSGMCDNCAGLGEDLCSCLGGFCSSCTGMGYHVNFTSKGVKERTCSTCHGTGMHSRCNGTGFINCSYCHGTGICSWCKGR